MHHSGGAKWHTMKSHFFVLWLTERFSVRVVGKIIRSMQRKGCCITVLDPETQVLFRCVLVKHARVVIFVYDD